MHFWKEARLSLHLSFNSFIGLGICFQNVRRSRLMWSVTRSSITWRTVSYLSISSHDICEPTLHVEYWDLYELRDPLRRIRGGADDRRKWFWCVPLPCIGFSLAWWGASENGDVGREIDMAAIEFLRVYSPSSESNCPWLLRRGEGASNIDLRRPGDSRLDSIGEGSDIIGPQRIDCDWIRSGRFNTRDSDRIGSNFGKGGSNGRTRPVLSYWEVERVSSLPSPAARGKKNTLAIMWEWNSNMCADWTMAKAYYLPFDITLFEPIFSLLCSNFAVQLFVRRFSSCCCVSGAGSVHCQDNSWGLACDSSIKCWFPSNTPKGWYKSSKKTYGNAGIVSCVAEVK